MKCSNPNCNRQIEVTPRMKQMQAENPRTEFFCRPCTKRMADERIANKMGWVRK